MSHISTKEFSDIRKTVTKKREQILAEISAKKTITRNQCQKYIEELSDVLICYDPILSLSSPQMQPFVKLNLIQFNETNETNSTSTEPMTTSTPKAIVSSVEKNQNDSLLTIFDGSEDNTQIPLTVSKTSVSDNVRYKTMIRGMDSVKSNDSDKEDDDWSAQTSISSTKKAKTSRQTRSQSSKVTDKKTKSKQKPEDNDSEANGWTSGGHVLGGDVPTQETDLSPEERRRIIREKSEKRLDEMSKRGVKGVVRLASRTQADINGPNNNEPNPLKWSL